MRAQWGLGVFAHSNEQKNMEIWKSISCVDVNHQRRRKSDCLWVSERQTISFQRILMMEWNYKNDGRRRDHEQLAARPTFYYHKVPTQRTRWKKAHLGLPPLLVVLSFKNYMDNNIPWIFMIFLSFRQKYYKKEKNYGPCFPNVPEKNCFLFFFLCPLITIFLCSLHKIMITLAVDPFFLLAWERLNEKKSHLLWNLRGHKWT